MTFLGRELQPAITSFFVFDMSPSNTPGISRL